MKSIVAAATLAFALAAGPAAADEDGRFYLGAGVGQLNLKIGGFEGQPFDDSSISAQLFGGIRLNPYFALEIFYSRYGETEDDVQAAGDVFNAQLEISGYGPYLVGMLPLGRFELFAKIGYLFHETDLKTRDAQGVIAAGNGSSEDAIYAAGVGMLLFDGLELRLAYEVLDISTFDQPDLIWLTGAWRF